MTEETHSLLWDAINAYAASCGGDTSSVTVGDQRMGAVSCVERQLSAARLEAEARMSAALAAGVGGESGVFPDWVYAARAALLHQKHNLPWLPDLLSALGWTHGTLHEALACVKRLVQTQPTPKREDRLVAFNRQDFERLAAQGCQAPGCDHKAHGDKQPIYFHSRCHPAAGVEASYRVGSGVLTLRCNTCKKLVSTVSVKEN